MINKPKNQNMLHCLQLDGVYRLTDCGPVFQAVPAPTATQLQTLLAQMIQRPMKGLTRHDALIEEHGIPYRLKTRTRYFSLGIATRQTRGDA